MYLVQDASFLAPEIKMIRLEAPRIAKHQQAGQFVIVRVHEQGERIPLTIADSDASTITLIVQGVGKTTRLLNQLQAGDAILDVVGPLGRPSEIQLYGRTLVIGGGVGSAIAWPLAVALKAAGNEVVVVIGAKTQRFVILEKELTQACDQLFVMTDDGSYGEQGLVTDKLRELIHSQSPWNYVMAIGPIPMMKAVAETTRPAGIPTTASLNPIMIDGTGMCGGCRVLVGGETRFACVDGPEFDAHLVDFDVLAQRNKLYRQQEQAALQEPPERTAAALSQTHPCRLSELTSNLPSSSKGE
ncbi:sulfide/dihydroorotate dehydrogenase-like FAD/NAD-binding protein [Lignipirellula cremea]|uniref:Dihydroorotate dehydrogenase B (NAD(+)), electron transfer subunit n=1 Tax=Lignipirellula cremea TaxID=2528010 RepID=A0A518E475_9BACT|nr:sulfide/dihydroorotate dehydrogenase-like FAD/NAD-binding protein [Lignipirellula cremea]QDU98867.1 Dihydroorotate dehydrogenase B (NAD(+)), electron transfer subunit [Lignipirellula cremea]